ncbi:TolC family protein [Dinghuibacter silviterrae]|uniref:Outer membrane protein TolC n=1 Tax=Dinghuibacter silviterrae TaxID=1539049 RepID=A0A4R8DHJ2_9BACT|nr:TolC family protein [Dinghuibacter silviterrae]TDW96420.1 outer membrane protein TolC [Dinghuibacter silviterrae]
MEKTLIVVLLTGLFLPARAQDSTRLTSVSSFAVLWEKVRRDNPSQRVYALNVQKARIDRAASRSFLYPSVGGAFNGQDNLSLAVTPVPGELVGRPGTTYNVQFGKHYTYGTGLTATETVFNWTSVLDNRIATNTIALNQAQAAYFEQTLKEQTARGYFTLLVSDAASLVAGQDLLLADSLVEMTGQRLREGLTDASAVNLAKIDAGNVRSNLAQSRLLHDQALENLRVLLGMGPGDSLSISERLDLRQEVAAGAGLTAGTAFTLGPDKNLDVYRTQVEGAILTKRERATAFYPTLGLDGYLGVQQFRDEFALSFKPGAWNNLSYIGLNLSVPLFTGFYNLEHWKSARVSEAVANLQYDDARLQSLQADDLLRRQYADYLDMVQVSRDNFLLYGQNLELSRAKFSEGLLAIDSYLKTFEDYLNAENTYLNNMSNLLNVQASILARN